MALGRPSWWRFAAYGTAVTLLGYAHMMGLLVLAGHAVAVAVRRRAGRDRRPAVRWAVVVVAAIALVSPLIRLGLRQRGTQLEWIAPMDLHQVLIAPGVIFGAPAVGLLIIGLASAARWRHQPLLVGEMAAPATRWPTWATSCARSSPRSTAAPATGFLLPLGTIATYERLTA